MKRSYPLHISDIIAKAIDDSGNRQSYDQQQLIYLWPEVVGPTINKHTTHRYIDSHRVLHVYINSAALKNELAFMRTRLCQRLNEIMGKEVITDVMIH